MTRSVTFTTILSPYLVEACYSFHKVIFAVSGIAQIDGEKFKS
jgi:hypothetical protein